MKYEGEIPVQIDSEQLWNFIVNPERMASCFPGIKTFTKEGDEYKVVGTAGIGFIKGEYKAVVKFLDIDTQKKTLNLVAKGNGLNSNVDISALIQVLDNPVRLKYSADVKVGGVIASIGARLMDSAVGKIVNDLFECVKTKVK
ncbi:CoxG family protein [Stygiolobus caldivivus]|uniref:Carbon monoxide dehydrogenase n=1 Tax=Stygiolobus caldivivus TaxID=2824673 RepID=A0A8D5U5S7_9CREN|nr:CoxG family protein [Stygiolobus caldivivus]BCU69517.1 carbon monoxide dehydrogenase [Stygiolobus caldivivus]